MNLSSESVAYVYSFGLSCLNVLFLFQESVYCSLVEAAPDQKQFIRVSVLVQDFSLRVVFCAG